jgi:hypothetical protein
MEQEVEEQLRARLDEWTKTLKTSINALLEAYGLPNQFKCAVLTDCLVKALHEATPETRKVIGLHWLDWASKNRGNWH